ncbi:MAG: nucleoside kinase [Candidatus Ruminococcus intestinipullorum]|nr:nucleoside kinase [Candidatus Ruminococcus intestinipullorum]
MKSEFCTVQIGKQVKEYEKGIPYKTIAQEFQKEYDNQIVLVCVDGLKVKELNKRLKKDCRLSFITTEDTIGFETYKRSLCFMMVKAVHDVGGHESVQNVRIHFSVSKGYYCTVEGDVDFNQEFLNKVEKRMWELQKSAIPIEKRSVPTSDAVALFRKHGMYDKEKLFGYRRVSNVNIYKMKEFEDYYYGYMVPDTSYLNCFALYLYDEGFVLQMPEQGESKILPPFVPREKLFQVLKNSVKWGDLQNIETVGALNEMVTKNDMREIVLVQEAYQERQIAEIAAQIAAKPETKLVLIAGPSSSGKTTFSHRLCIQLRTQGMRPHPIAVDNYFVEREKTPRDKYGNYNFECLEAIDVEKFNEDMKNLLLGEEVYLPIFDFKNGRRTYNTSATQLGKQDILVIEGIHCLNPKLTEQLSSNKKIKIYISALTQLNVGEHNRIPSTDGRLIRRIVRDARTRGASAQKTIAMWPSVRRGEEENIFPFQEEADMMFNSSLLYELAVLKQYVEPLLFGVEKDSPEYMEAKRLLKFFDYFIGFGSDYVPMNSLLREFIGGGCFQV